jgi:hypothetical protein
MITGRIYNKLETTAITLDHTAVKFVEKDKEVYIDLNKQEDVEIYDLDLSTTTNGSEGCYCSFNINRYSSKEEAKREYERVVKMLQSQACEIHIRGHKAEIVECKNDIIK